MFMAPPFLHLYVVVRKYQKNACLLFISARPLLHTPFNTLLRSQHLGICNPSCYMITY